MQRGKDETRAKSTEIRINCDKQIKIQKPNLENTRLFIHQSRHSLNSTAHDIILNQGKIGTLKAELRAVEDDLVKAISVKTQKEAKRMAIADSLSAAKARIEELKKAVVDQRTRKEEYQEIISHQSEALKECEQKHKQDAEQREEIEDAISWYNKVLGFRIETGRGIKFIFTNINMKKPDEEYFFTIRLENDTYSFLDCHPHVTEIKKLVDELNETNGLYHFVRTMRTKFQEVSAGGNLSEIASHFQEITMISTSAPISVVSTDSGSGTPAKRSRKVGRKARHVQGSILSPGSAASHRRSPRFKVKE